MNLATRAQIIPSIIASGICVTAKIVPNAVNAAMMLPSTGNARASCSDVTV